MANSDCDPRAFAAGAQAAVIAFAPLLKLNGSEILDAQLSLGRSASDTWRRHIQGLTDAQLTAVYMMAAAGLDADKIAAVLGLDVDQVRVKLKPTETEDENS